MTTTTLSIGSAQLTVDTQALFQAWFEKHLGTPVSTVPDGRDGGRCRLRA